MRSNNNDINRAYALLEEVRIGLGNLDIVQIPSASPARRGQTFCVVTSAEIRLRNVERWRRGAMHRKARTASQQGAGLAVVARDAIAMAQAASMAHRPASG